MENPYHFESVGGEFGGREGSFGGRCCRNRLSRRRNDFGALVVATAIVIVGRRCDVCGLFRASGTAYHACTLICQDVVWDIQPKIPTSQDYNCIYNLMPQNKWNWKAVLYSDFF